MYRSKNAIIEADPENRGNKLFPIQLQLFYSAPVWKTLLSPDDPQPMGNVTSKVKAATQIHRRPKTFVDEEAVGNVVNPNVSGEMERLRTDKARRQNTEIDRATVEAMSTGTPLAAMLSSKTTQRLLLQLIWQMPNASWRSLCVKPPSATDLPSRLWAHLRLATISGRTGQQRCRGKCQERSRATGATNDSCPDTAR